MSGNRLILRTSWLLTTVVLINGCDNAIEPLAPDSDSFVFVNGFLDSAADSQFVRLEGLRPTILADPRNLSTVTVTTTDRVSGESTTWRDSLIVLDDGSTGLLYVGVFQPREGHEYELSVSREGFEAATASTTVPAAPNAEPGEPTGNDISLVQTVFLEGLDSAPFSLVMRYDIVLPGTGELRTFLIDYGDGGRLSGSGWRFDVFLVRDQQIIAFALKRESGAPRLGLRRVAARVVIKSTEWGEREKPINLFLAEGFFASVGRYDSGWVLDPDAVDNVGFLNDQHSWQAGKQDLFDHEAVLLSASAEQLK